MRALLQDFKKWHRGNPNRALVLGVSVLVLGLSLWTGRQARSVAAGLAKKMAAWQQAAGQLVTVRQQFRTPNSTESSALIAEAARMGALGVAPSDRVSLLELVARLADASGLSEVRVNVRSGLDSAFVAPRMIGADAINPAGYALTIDCTGSFAGLVQFVTNLPPSVSVARLGAGRHGNSAAYHIILSVYEIPNGDSAD